MFPTDKFKIFTLFNHPFIYLFFKNQFCCHTSWKFHLECINLILSHEHGQHIFDFWIYHRKSTILDITHVHKSILHWLEPLSWHCMHLSLLTVHSPTQNTPKKKKKKKHTHTHTTIWGEENSLRSRVPLNRASKNHFSLLAPQTKQTRLPSHPPLSLSLSLCFWFLNPNTQTQP